ncbi:lateral signaling target protein 2 homolog [Orussus abietinus]|uniref:lateral signaling target protein 2 homolog n=1 Tax=Orussus abietinus TaxID=222816 RepID=UPI00062569AB|nr:lateral signaling target protein 2 homolog [Orussus abietinus]
MESIRKWFCRPKRDDTSLLAQFFYADESLNTIACELDSFDGRQEPERCTSLVNQLRHCQDKVLMICNQIMDDLIPGSRANRDFRVKFPDDVMQENLAGQLWFGAECLAAGSSIMNREAESSAMRPLAKALTKSLETVRNLLREYALKGNMNLKTQTPFDPTLEKLIESLKIFDRLFADFELCYVGAMVPVKSIKEYEQQELVCVLFSESLQKALKRGLFTQADVDNYEPALMFTIPRLAIVSGLLAAPGGPLCLNSPDSLSEMFRPFRTLLLKIRELLWTLNSWELYMLEKLLCSNEEPSSKSRCANDSELEEFVHTFYKDNPNCKQLIVNFYTVPRNSMSTMDEGATDVVEMVRDGHKVIGLPSEKRSQRRRQKGKKHGDLKEVRFRHSNVNYGLCKKDPEAKIEAEKQFFDSRSHCKVVQISPARKGDYSTRHRHHSCTDMADEKEDVGKNPHLREWQSSLDGSISSKVWEDGLGNVCTGNEEPSVMDSHEQVSQEVEVTSEIVLDLDANQLITETNVTLSNLLLNGEYHVENSEQTDSGICTVISSENASLYDKSPEERDPFSREIRQDDQEGPGEGPIDAKEAFPGRDASSLDKDGYTVSGTSYVCGVSNLEGPGPTDQSVNPLNSPGVSLVMEGQVSFNSEHVQEEVYTKNVYPGRCESLDPDRREPRTCPKCDKHQGMSSGSKKRERKTQQASTRRQNPEEQERKHQVHASSTLSSPICGSSATVDARNLSISISDSFQETLQGQEAKLNLQTGYDEKSESLDSSGDSLSPGRDLQYRTCPKCEKLQLVHQNLNATSKKRERKSQQSTSKRQITGEQEQKRHRECERKDCSYREYKSTFRGAEKVPKDSCKMLKGSKEGSCCVVDPEPQTSAEVTRSTRCGNPRLGSFCMSLHRQRTKRQPNESHSRYFSQKHQHCCSRSPQTLGQCYVRQVECVCGNSMQNRNLVYRRRSQSIARLRKRGPRQVHKYEKKVDEQEKTRLAVKVPMKLLEDVDQRSDISVIKDSVSTVVAQNGYCRVQAFRETSRSNVAPSKLINAADVSRNYSCSSYLSLVQRPDADSTSSCSSCCDSSSETSEFESDRQNDEEIALAMQAAEVANRNQIRAKFRSSEDLVHRLFVCIAGVADQLQTNFASDLRNILKCVFLMNSSQTTDASDKKLDNLSLLSHPEDFIVQSPSTNNEHEQEDNRVKDMSDESVPTNERSPVTTERGEECTEKAPAWVPDNNAPRCMACQAVFTVVRRRHHCRNCGKVFCGRCSSNSVPLPRFGHMRAVRVCNKCFLYQVTPFT